jgi:sugar phosphate isomerase/epimerase
MLTRRRFAGLAVAAAGAAFIAPLKSLALLADPLNSQTVSTRSGLEFGVQLFMVRNLLNDLPSILHQIREVGYTHVEPFSAAYNRPAKELKSLIANNGLKAYSGHFDYATLEEKVDYAAELGLKYMICPMIPPPQWDSLDGFRLAAEHLNKAAVKARAAGLNFGYHPHSYEFKPLQGQRGFDVLMQELNPATKLQLDVYWAIEAGQNALELMRNNRSRLALIHIKDRKPTKDFSFSPLESINKHNCTEAGSGTIDWTAVLGEAKRFGVTQFVVDQDETDLTMDESLRKNWKYLSQLNV